MDKRRVVITGLGVVAPNGIGLDAFWQANVAGKSGVDAVKSFDPSGFGSRIAGQVKDFDPAQHLPFDIVKRTDRFVHLGLVSAKMAIQDSRLDLPSQDKTRIGVIFGSGLGGVLFHEGQMIAAYQKNTRRFNPLCVPRITPNAVASQIAIFFGLLGPNMVISNACASGTNAVGEAARKIQHGEADIIVSGGCEAPLTEFTFGAYDAMRILSKYNDEPQTASRPFDNTRDGFVMGEGGAALILEELAHAKNRQARIYAELKGYSANSGAYHMAMPKPDAEDITRALILALNDAGVDTRQIDYINAHGTSTVQNDKAETQGIKNVFGERAGNIPISSTKSMIGHTIGAAGAIEALVSCLVIEHKIIPPTINYNQKDPDCDLDYVPNTARSAEVNTVLSNSFGFGSNNACLIFGRYYE